MSRKTKFTPEEKEQAERHWSADVWIHLRYAGDFIGRNEIAVALNHGSNAFGCKGCIYNYSAVDLHINIYRGRLTVPLKLIMMPMKRMILEKCRESVSRWTRAADLSICAGKRFYYNGSGNGASLSETAQSQNNSGQNAWECMAEKRRCFTKYSLCN